jgi:hypothetical protein
VKWRSLFPINTEVPSGADTFSYNLFDEMGEFKLGDPDADDFPMVDVKGSNSAGVIKSIFGGYGYSIQDLRASMMTGRPLDVQRGRAARRIFERKVDALVAVGDTPTGMKGITNASNINSVSKGSQASGTTWATATGDEIRKDVESLLQASFTNTKGAFGQEMTLMVGTAGYSRLSTQRLDGFNQVTVGQYLLSAIPWLKAIEFWPRLDTAGGSSKERVMVYPRDPEVLEVIISQDFEQFAPQARNLRFIIPCHSRFGGVDVRQPKAISYMDGTEP